MSDVQPFWEAGYQDQDAETFGSPSEELVVLADTLAPDTVVLDVGCGDGRNAIHFASRGFRVRAFDISATGVRKLKARAGSRDLEIDAWVQDIREFKFDRSYGLILCHGVLHFLEPRFCNQFLEVMRRHTAQCGLNVHTVFTNRLKPPSDLTPFLQRIFKEGEIRDMYRDWEIELFESYIKVDEHPGGIRHRHPINKLVARKPCDG